MTTTHAQAKPRVGFIGMGNMGSLMAIRLLQAGYPITVYDRTSEKTQEAVQHGAHTAHTPRELATDSDVVLSSVSDNHALTAIMHGTDGAIAGAKTGSVFIDLSTVSPAESRRIAEEVEHKGGKLLDAAVSGSTPQVREGNLVIFVGGDQGTFDCYRTLLEVLGKNIFYMGAQGLGTTMKMVVNTLLGLGLQAVAEAIALGEKAGLQKEQLIDALAQTTVIAPAHKSKLENLKQEQYPEQFGLAMMRKDFSLIMRLAAELSVSMPATAAAEQAYAAALAQGLDGDYSIMLRFMEQLSGIHAQEQVAARS